MQIRPDRATDTVISNTMSDPGQPRREKFTTRALPAFLNSGWVLSIPSDQGRRLAVGWGPLRSYAESPVRNPGDAALFAPDFRLRAQRPWLTTPCWDIVDRTQFNAVIRSQAADGSPSLKWREPAKALFEKRFNTIQERFENDMLDKAVPVAFATARASVDSHLRLHMLRNLIQMRSDLFIYGVWGRWADSAANDDRARTRHIEQGMLGVTSELLFSLSGHAALPMQLETAALAGTRAWPEDPASAASEARALLADPKERAEHQFVVDDITRVLQDIADVHIGATQVQILPTLFHLKTPISARLHRPLDIAAAARLLHPTPALGFAPRALGIGEMDHWDDGTYRWRFGAPFGIDAIADTRGSDNKRTIRPGAITATTPTQHLQECVVAIRNLQWRGDDVRLGSGCGMVRASQLEREWQELQLKRASVRRALGV